MTRIKPAKPIRKLKLVKPNPDVEYLLASFYNELSRHLLKMSSKKKPTVKQIINAYNKYTGKYSILIEKELEKLNTISFDITKIDLGEWKTAKIKK